MFVFGGCFVIANLGRKVGLGLDLHLVGLVLELHVSRRQQRALTSYGRLQHLRELLHPGALLSCPRQGRRGRHRHQAVAQLAGWMLRSAIELLLMHGRQWLRPGQLKGVHWRLRLLLHGEVRAQGSHLLLSRQLILTGQLQLLLLHLMLVQQ